MIEHLVLFKWKEDASDSAIAKVMEGLKNLPNEIPEIIALSCGENFSSRSQGFQHGLVVRFSDREALATYQAHPAHQEVVQDFIKPILQDILAVDYQLD